jgi:beta-glucosidase/6-phospho-beta-glucosidase/beta-galactosidase
MVCLQILGNVPTATNRAGEPTVMEFFQKADTVHKTNLPDNHHQVNGVKVFRTIKTTGQVGFVINIGIKLPAQGTQKTKTPLAALAGDIQNIFDQHIYGDIVSKCKELASGEVFCCHIRPPDPVWDAD